MCRRYAYRILGLIATRCFDTVGEKVVGHLLLKKRHQEVPENRLTITIILWNLMFIWPEYLTHILLFPDFVTPNYGMSAAVGSDSLLIDLWDDSDSVPSAKTITVTSGMKKSVSDRSASIISIARIIVAKRLASQEMNKLVVRKASSKFCTDTRALKLLISHLQVREIILSFLSRSTVAIVIGNSVAETRRKQFSNDIPISKKKKQKKDVERTLNSSSVTVADIEVSGFAKEDFTFKLSILNVTDVDDYAGNSAFH